MNAVVLLVCSLSLWVLRVLRIQVIAVSYQHQSMLPTQCQHQHPPL